MRAATLREQAARGFSLNFKVGVGVAVGSGWRTRPAIAAAPRGHYRAPVSTFRPGSALLEVLVFREGVLSAVGHDLLLRATDFEITLDPAAPPSVSAQVDAASLRVAAAMRDGRVLEGGLSPADVREIETTLRATVLDAKRFPVIRFASTAVARVSNGWKVEGALTVKATTRSVAFAVRREGERLAAELPLDQPAFGIRPYRAMLGALRVKPEVRVRASIPAEGL